MNRNPDKGSDDMRILFMGTPDFAVLPFLVLTENFEVIGVVTQPDKPKGRHMTLTPSAVKMAAIEKNIPVFQPTTLKDGSFQDTLDLLKPDAIVVVAYGKILPKYVLDYPKYGCINLHGSLLPKYRGAAPMQRALIEGEKETGVTTMYMAEGLDTGDLLEVAKTDITEEDNFESIHDRLSEIGSSLLISTLSKLKDGMIVPKKQDDSLATYAAKIENQDCRIDFSQGAYTVFNQVRGLSPFPLAYCRHNGKMLKVIDCRVLPDSDTLLKAHPNAVCGEVLSLDKGCIAVKCNDGVLSVRAVLPEGKSRMKASDYINGRRIQVGDVLESL